MARRGGRDEFSATLLTPAGAPGAARTHPLLAGLRDGLIVSCQPVAGGPLDHPSLVAAFALAAGRRGCVAVGVAVTGLVLDGLWRALDPQTLPIPDGRPLTAGLARHLGLPVTARDDARAVDGARP